MKKIILLFTLLISTIGIAQDINNRALVGPQGFNYKALVIDNGAPLANATITVKVTFKSYSTTKWVETHSSVQTDANGIFTIFLGEGTRVSGATSFNDINWHVTNMNITVEINTGSGYQTLVSNEKLSYMPFAKYADKSYNSTWATNATNADNATNATNATHATSADNATHADGATTADHLADQEDNGIRLITTTGSNHMHGFRLSKNSDDWYLFMNTTSDFVIKNNTQEAFKIMDADNSVYIINNLGVGTSTPSERITVSGNNNEIIKVETSGSSKSSGILLKTDGTTYDFLSLKKYGNGTGGSIDGISISNLSLIHAGPSAGSMMIDVMTNNPMYFLTNNQLAMTIENTGNLKMEKKITAEASGDADMKAYAYGYIDEDANIASSRSSGGFTATKHHVAVGSGYDYYKITFNDSSINSNYVALANVDSGQARFCTVAKSSDAFYVYIYDHTGAHVTDQFYFVVYRK